MGIPTLWRVGLILYRVGLLTPGLLLLSESKSTYKEGRPQTHDGCAHLGNLRN
jgi:hypothetical protein